MFHVGRLLQLLGLVVVPMALIYYATNLGKVSETKLMFGEMAILIFGALCFLLGKALSRT